MSPFSDEHYKAIVEVSRDLTSIIREKNGAAGTQVKAIDSLGRLVDMLGVIECSCSPPGNPISGS